mmetsp:Transcript_18477/g.31625  ORF Transcript_18477/g.31625 Transcript_18477/m.31625 type:complete len:116 (-) Transcript_18477:62-409(-)
MLPVGGSIVQEYQDPLQRVVVNQETVDQRMDVRKQYQNQVFKPGHNMPTKTLDELAEEEMTGALDRQAKDQEAERQRAEEDSEDEEIIERERQKQMHLEDWKDHVPKGRGVTKRI